MQNFPAILAFVVGVAGWYYLFYSKAATRLDGIESPTINNRRSRLRRINGVAMLLLAVGFYAGFKFDPDLHPALFLGIWIVVMLLLLLVVTLAIVDLRLTARLRRKS
jgi:amino acid transporter